MVALTFDACATLKQPNGFDRKVFDILAAERIPATFYLSGRWVEKHPASAKAIAAAPFIELGNHSYSHPRLTLVREERLRWQIRSTSKILEERLGRRPLTLRPPAGAWNADVVRAANQEGLPVVTWSVISGDVGGRMSAAADGRARARADQARLDHHLPHQPARALHGSGPCPRSSRACASKGFRFVTVSQLLALPDGTPEAARPSRFGPYQRRRRAAPMPAKVAMAPPARADCRAQGEPLAHKAP